jgi:integrase/recombinase XerD
VANTQSKEVNLSKRVQTAKGMRYCPVVLASNRRVKPDLVILNGKPERHLEGAYHSNGGSTAGGCACQSERTRLTPVHVASGRKPSLTRSIIGVAVLPENGDNGHRSVAIGIAEFLEETKLTKKPKTLAAYTTALNYFTESCPKLFLNDIERKDLLKFCAFLRDEKSQAPRSVYNKFENLMTFLKAQGIRGLVGKNGRRARDVRKGRSRQALQSMR